MFEIELPYPPSINHYYRNVGFRTLISREGRLYREKVVAFLRGLVEKPLIGCLAIKLEAYPPDRRRRDLDNIFKVIFDSLQHGGAFNDDSQIREIAAKMNEPMPPDGMVYVRLENATS